MPRYFTKKQLKKLQPKHLKKYFFLRQKKKQKKTAPTRAETFKTGAESAKAVPKKRITFLPFD